MSQFLHSLRAATAEEHRKLEEVMSIEDEVACEESYRVLLKRMWEIWSPLEQLLAASSLADSETLQLHRRFRSPQLENDLRSLGQSLPDSALAPPLAPSLESPPTRESAAGILYVLEGSRFGGKVILKTLNTLGVSAEVGGSFFHGYGADTSAMWDRFVQWADEEIDETQLPESCRAAKTVFQMFQRHFDQIHHNSE